MAKNLDDLRDRVYPIIDPITQWLVRRRVHPNAITTSGFVMTVIAGLLFGTDHVRTAGFFVLLGGAHDIFDGRVARLTGLQSKFGAFYDSTLDRISEIVVYLGLISLYNQYEMDLLSLGMIYVVALAMAGSLMISYTRAKAETLGLECSVGLMQRAERVVLLGLGSLIFGLSWDGLVLTGVIVIFAVLTNWTAIHRIVWVYRQAAGVPLDDAPALVSIKEKDNGEADS
ncbi:MAG: CDP-alcohol phosphatidyltransferase family protein [Gemmatimonadetes bacterium]|nr:MAG: CDP-alcohol phosphatidyltransferase family protein [Gemmatimonadota bacterium]